MTRGMCMHTRTSCIQRNVRRGFAEMKKMQRRAWTAVLMGLLLTCCLVVGAQAAVGYEDVYGRTLDRVRVRASASMSAAIEDNIVSGACVFALDSDYVGGVTWIRVRYRDYEGDIATGWVCQNDGSTTYVQMLSRADAKNYFGVEDGDLPSKRVGTFTRADKTSSNQTSGSVNSYGYLQLGSEGTAVRNLQEKLTALGYYDGTISGHFGEKTEAAVKAYQTKAGLYSDGIAGPATQAKLFGTSTSSTAGSKVNLTSDEIRQLQENLKALGFYESGSVTGNYGTLTEEAVRQFQRKYGLDADGIAGTKTLAKIQSLLGSSSSGTGADASGMLKPGSSGTAVRQLQEDLKTLGFYDGSVTGNYGTLTEDAVRRFQKRNGLDSDGIAGTKTLAAIASALTGGSSSSGGTISTSSVLKSGSSGTAVRQLQENLKKLGYYESGSVTGNYGPLTEEAVRQFQRKNGLDADGIAGAKTLAAINSAINGGGSSSGSSSSGSATGTLKLDDEGEAVKQLQKDLTTLGFYSGEISGHYGSLTKEAVRQFQKKNDLDADGVAGAKTLNKIKALITGVDDENPSGIIVTPTLRSNYGRTNKDKVNVRTGPSTSYKSKTMLALNTYFRITESVSNDNYIWYKISYTVGGYSSTGYIRSDMAYVLTKTEAEDYLAGNVSGGGEVVVNGYVKITGDGVRLRMQPSTDADVYRSADKGEIFAYIRTTTDAAGKTWYGLKIGYWVYGDYVTTNVSDEEIAGSGSSGSGSGSSGYRTLKQGMEGDDVRNLQQALRKLGYYGSQYSISGNYGLWTAEAVRQFQLANGLDADAIAGPKTQAAIYAALNNSATTDPDHSLDGTTYYNVDYFTYRDAIVKAWGSQTGTIYDIQSGKQWNVKHLYHGNHFDVEPMTAADTAVMCQAYGVSSADKIPYNRRAVLLTVGNQTFCASMYGQGHGDDTLPNNNYSGQFCIHLKNSKLNGGDSGDNETVDSQHQAAVQKAYDWVVKNKGKTPSSVYP